MDFLSTKVAYASLDTFISHVSTQIINPLILLLFALAMVYFLYGLVEFIANANNDEKRTSGKSHMLWGIIGLTIMMGVWFILRVILSTLGISQSEIDPKAGTIRLPPYTPPSPNNLGNPR